MGDSTHIMRPLGESGTFKDACALRLLVDLNLKDDIATLGCHVISARRLSAGRKRLHKGCLYSGLVHV